MFAVTFSEIGAVDDAKQAAVYTRDIHPRPYRDIKMRLRCDLEDDKVTDRTTATHSIRINFVPGHGVLPTLRSHSRKEPLRKRDAWKLPTFSESFVGKSGILRMYGKSLWLSKHRTRP